MAAGASLPLPPFFVRRERGVRYEDRRVGHAGGGGGPRSTTRTRLSNPALSPKARGHDSLTYSPLQCVPLKHSGQNCCLSYTGEVKLYLDNSFLNRFFDDPAIGINNLEREILLRILHQAHT